MAAFNFHAAVQEFLVVISNLDSTDESTSRVTEKVWATLGGSDAEKKSALDQAFRQLLAKKLSETGMNRSDQEELNGANMEEMTNGNAVVDVPLSSFKQLITCVISHAQEKKCTSSLPILLLSDVFDTITLDHCERLFEFVEENVVVWTKEPFFNSGKNHLLRMCNDLLRRLSKSLNTIFCGRIQLFLARLFPVEEKSALNIMSQFHMENVTIYKKDKDDFIVEDLDAMDTDDGEVIEATNPVDFNLYTRFWSLQDFFRNPAICYVPKSWRNFKDNVTEILKVFETYKIEYNEKRRKGSESESVTLSDIMKGTSHSHQDYFPKYLTNEKLLNLQINDSNFRRYFLVQILILCQYLTGYVKFKQPAFKLSDAQTNWVKDTVETVYKVLENTPPNGKKFTAAVKHILNREENWINWKNEGCQTFAKTQKDLAKPVAKEVAPKSKKSKSKVAVKRSMADEFLNSNNKRINMGTPELTRLWNLCPDNMEACKAENRLKFLPTLENFFEDAIEQSDPDAGIEDEYKVVNHANFQWRALRLLARRSHHFFTPSATPFKALPQYLSSVIEQLGKELDKNSSATSTTAAAVINESRFDPKVKTEPVEN